MVDVHVYFGEESAGGQREQPTEELPAESIGPQINSNKEESSLELGEADADERDSRSREIDAEIEKAPGAFTTPSHH